MTKAITKYNIGIIGCGKMGKDLFSFLNGFPFQLTLICKTEAAAEQSLKAFHKKQKRALKYQLITQDVYDFRIKNTIITTNQKRLTVCNLVIETISEDLHKKRELFHQIQSSISTDCVLASNTSSIPPDELIAGLINEKNGLGLHFFFPLGMKDIVEINVAKNTSSNTVSFIKSFLKRIGKFSVELSTKNHFIINRIFLKMQAGCCQLVQDDKCSIQEIDSLVKTHLFPFGLFGFFDQVGNDVMLQSVRNYVKYEGNPEFYLAMVALLEQKVSQGRLGVKSKMGFYEYPLKNPQPGALELPEVLQKIVHWYLDGVFGALEKSVCSKAELVHIVKEYMSVEKSPFEWVEAFGYKPK